MAGHFLCKSCLFFFFFILITFRPWASTFCASSPSVLTEAPWSGHCCPILPTKRLRTKDFKDLHGVTQLVGSRSRIPPGIMGLGVGVSPFLMGREGGVSSRRLEQWFPKCGSWTSSSINTTQELVQNVTF